MINDLAEESSRRARWNVESAERMSYRCSTEHKMGAALRDDLRSSRQKNGRARCHVKSAARMSYRCSTADEMGAALRDDLRSSRETLSTDISREEVSGAHVLPSLDRS